MCSSPCSSRSMISVCGPILFSGTCMSLGLLYMFLFLLSFKHLVHILPSRHSSIPGHLPLHTSQLGYLLQVLVQALDVGPWLDESGRPVAMLLLLHPLGLVSVAAAASAASASRCQCRSSRVFSTSFCLEARSRTDHVEGLGSQPYVSFSLCHVLGAVLLVGISPRPSRQRVKGVSPRCMRGQSFLLWT